MMADSETVMVLEKAPDFSQDLVDYHVRQGKRLRAEAFQDLLGGVAGLFRKSPAAEAAEGGNGERETTLRASLAAIRSAAELLRDNPGIAPAERRRFVDIVLAEEQRLERLLPGIVPAGRGKSATAA